jgi:hypothetical protein
VGQITSNFLVTGNYLHTIARRASAIFGQSRRVVVVRPPNQVESVAHNGFACARPSSGRIFILRPTILVGTGRFELPTCRLGGDRSIHLSYVPAHCFNGQSS